MTKQPALEVFCLRCNEHHIADAEQWASRHIDLNVGHPVHYFNVNTLALAEQMHVPARKLLRQDKAKILSLTQSNCVYKLKKYKFRRGRRQRYEFSSTKRFCSMGELLQYLKNWRSGYDAFYNVMGYCYYPEDRFKVEITTPNPYAPREDLLPADVILNAARRKK